MPDIVQNGFTGSGIFAELTVEFEQMDVKNGIPVFHKMNCI